jgi:hypothetical protein
VQERKQILNLIESPDFDPHNSTILTTNPPFKISATDSNKVLVKKVHPQRIDLEARVKKPACLVSSQIFYKDWHVFVDGRKQDLVCANGLFQSVFLQPGIHKIVFIYRSKMFVTGMWVTIIALSLIIGLLIIVALFRVTGTVSKTL